MHPSTGLHLAGEVKNIYEQLRDALSGCPSECFGMPLPLLSGASIGEHTRHLIEFFQCLGLAADGGEVDYAKRPRDRRMETDMAYALDRFSSMLNRLPVTDGPCMVCTGDALQEASFRVASGWHRELLYAIEHAIHHMAIIKIGLKSLQLPVQDTFGVAPSTLQYRAQCVS